MDPVSSPNDVVFRRGEGTVQGHSQGPLGLRPPFGDFDLLFGAARCGPRIAEIPVRYRERTHGTSSIRRWRHGALLPRMVLVAAFRLKLV